jgi:hypothetical protein
VGKLSLVALDTNHIKRYVFATNKLREIRGASSLLDHLNRRVMGQIADDPAFHAQSVFANGGSGLFLLDSDVARAFALRVQQTYQKETSGGASIIFAIQELPPGVQDAWQDDLRETLTLLRYRLAEKKLSWLAGQDEQGDEVANHLSLTDCVTFVSHPFMHPCDACGQYYSEGRDSYEALDEAMRDEHIYCSVCLAKRTEDHAIKVGIDDLVEARRKTGLPASGKRKPFAWEQVLKELPRQYEIPPGTERPGDFNELRGMGASAKEYLGIIYADGNGMGQMLEELSTLSQLKEMAASIDQAVYMSIGSAIGQYLPIQPGEGRTPPQFPFDLLLVGGDDLMIVTPANRALDVALAIARAFHETIQKRNFEERERSLSIGVVLAPVKYPFGLLQRQAEETLQYAKRAGQDRSRSSKYGETRINFMTVTGSSSQNFEDVYGSLCGSEKHEKFYATLRPYTVEELEFLQNEIREGRKAGLGRGKLHQMREAVLKMNLTTSVYEGLAALRNWRLSERDFVARHVYTFASRYQQTHYDAEQPDKLFPRVTFPWFADGPGIYRTPLLDFVELYDFIAAEGGADEN